MLAIKSSTYTDVFDDSNVMCSIKNARINNEKTILKNAYGLRNKTVKSIVTDTVG